MASLAARGLSLGDARLLFQRLAQIEPEAAPFDLGVNDVAARGLAGEITIMNGRAGAVPTQNIVTSVVTHLHLAVVVAALERNHFFAAFELVAQERRTTGGIERFRARQHVQPLPARAGLEHVQRDVRIHVLTQALDPTGRRNALALT